MVHGSGARRAGERHTTLFFVDELAHLEVATRRVAERLSLVIASEAARSRGDAESLTAVLLDEMTVTGLNYPVARANCVSCHDPHGSNTAGLLFDTVHPPVAARRCNQCHNAATSAEPFATRRPGFELCRGCHGAMLNETFSKNRVHWPLVDKTGCLNCHEAHASRQKKLLNVEQASLCGGCHKDTIGWQVKLADKEQQERAAAKGQVDKGAFGHAPIQNGNCSACHLPHVSDSARLMRQDSVIEGCGACHDWLKHSSHPMGAKYADLRNRDLSLDCQSCHRAHGTGYRYLMTFPTTTDLCVQCHRQLRR